MKKSLSVAFILFLFAFLSVGASALECDLVSPGTTNGPYSVDGQPYYMGIKHKENSSYFLSYDQNCNILSSAVAEKVFEVYLVDKSSSAINSIDFNITTSEEFKKTLEQMRDAMLTAETGSNFARPAVQFVDDISPYIEKGATVAANADVVIRWINFKMASKNLQEGELSYDGIKEYKETCGKFVASGFSVFLVQSLKGAKKLAPIFIQYFYEIESTEKAKKIAADTKNFMNNYPLAYQAVNAIGEGATFIVSSTANKFCYPLIDAPAKYYAKDMQLQLTTGKGIRETTGETVKEVGEATKKAGIGFLGWIIEAFKRLFGLI